MRTGLFLLLIVGCASRPEGKKGVAPDEQQAVKNLKAQAAEVGRSAVEQDHAKMAELTHPFLIEKLGGRAAFVQKLESIAADMKGQGFGLKKFTMGEPSLLVPAAGQVYAVVPSEVELSGPGGAAGKQPSYLIAVSTDGGIQWKFIDGAGVGGDRRKLKSVLPDLPDQLVLPAAQPAVWDRK